MKKGLLALMIMLSFVATNVIYAEDNIDLYSDTQVVTYSEETEEVTKDIVTFNSADLKQAILNTGIDTDKDGELTPEEMLSLKSLSCSYDTIVDLTGLEYAFNLKTLTISSSDLKDISALANLTNITSLNLRSNEIDDISAIANLTNITYLNLRYNNITDVTPLEKLTKVTEIDLDYNAIASLDGLDNMTELVNLTAVHNHMIDISALSNLTKIKALNLSYNDIVDISGLSKSVNIVELDLSNNKIVKIDALANMTKLGSGNLADFNLSNNQIEDITPLAKNIENYNKYTCNIYLSNNNISSIEPLKGLNFDKRIVKLNNNKISDISILSDFSYIYSLDLSNNQISDISALSNLTKLGELQLPNNNISNITALKHLKEASTLNLSGNKITDVRALANTNFTNLGIANNNIDVDKIVTLYVKETLNLSNNNIEKLDGLLSKVYATYLRLDDNKISDVSCLNGCKHHIGYSLWMSGNNINVYLKHNAEALEYMKDSIEVVNTSSQKIKFARGDINHDGKVNEADVLYFGRYLNGMSGYVVTEDTADLNGDYVIDWLDYKIIKNEIDMYPLASVTVDLKPGDLNKDGYVNQADINYFGKYLNGVAGYEVLRKLADVNNDKLIDWNDYQILKKYVARVSGYTSLPKEYVKGDVNRDYVLDEADINFFGKYLNGKEGLVMLDYLADVNGDGLLDWYDYKILKAGIADSWSYYEIYEPYYLGDVNRDHKVNLSDINYLGKYLNGSNVVLIEKLADLNDDGVIDWNDYKVLKEYVNRYNTGTDVFNKVPVRYAIGDINRDYVINDSDLTYFGKYLNGMNNYSVVNKLSDTNFDGIVDWVDYQILKRYLAGEKGFEVIPVIYDVGDVNKDCVVNTADVNYLGKYLNGMSGYEVETRLADINKDGIIDWEDYKQLKAII